MTPTTAPLPVPAVPPEVTAFAAEAGVTAYLPGVVQMTRRVFPDLPLGVWLQESFFGEPGEGYIVFEVEVGDREAGGLLAASERWTATLHTELPPTAASHFHLSLF